MDGLEALVKNNSKYESEVDRDEFCQRIQEVYRNKKGTNTFLFTEEKYVQIVEQLKAAKTKVKKTASDYRRIKRYVVVDTPAGERLYAVPKANEKPQQMFVTIQEMYSIIREYHLKFSHGGKNRISVALKPFYKNITTESIIVYLQMCVPCRNKLVVRRGKCPKTQGSSKPEENFEDSCDDDTDPPQTEMVQMDSEMELDLEQFNKQILEDKHPELYSRGQVDILDVTTDSNEEYKYMMVYRDFVNKYIHLKPLKAVSVDETAEILLDIFLVFGAPNILQSKNGVTVITPVCRRICALCPEIKMVPGNGVFSKEEFKGKSNEDILKHLNKWLEESQSTKWQQGLKYVQHSLNTTFQVETCRTASELVFGRNPRKGLASFMSASEYECIMTEEDLTRALGDDQNKRSSKRVKLEESLVLPSNFIKMEQDNVDVNEENPFENE